jgi:probable rRNA maturation factor
MNVKRAVDVQRCSAGSWLPEQSEINSWVDLVTHDLPYSVSLSVRMVDEAESRELNHRFRQRDVATNVLSFPCDMEDEDKVRVLGDVVVCAPLVASEAQSQGKNVRDHWAHLIIHGVLHLLGYDHQAPEEAAIMENLEITLLQELEINNPYGELA